MARESVEAGGMIAVKSDQRDNYNHSNSDANYKPNHNGLYELQTREMKQAGFPRQHDGKVLKIVVPMLSFLRVHEYEVIFMRRDYEETRQSLEASFKIRRTVEQIEQETEEGLRYLRNRRDVHRIMEWNYREVLADPLRHFESLHWPIDNKRAASVVDSALCRFQLEKLEVGI